MASPFQTTAAGVKAIFDAEFAAEGFKLIYDKPHDALGTDRVVAGIYPVLDRARSNNMVVQENIFEVKFLGLWDKEIDPDQMVNPFKVTDYAERLKKALRVSKATDPGTDDVWYFDVIETRYPPDPTDNITRFIMQIRAFGTNHGLVETGA